MNPSKPELRIDLDALVANWLLMRSHVHHPTDCGAVVKADAYGVGVSRVAPELYLAGCRTFYVSNLEEALQLKGLIDSSKSKIFVLTGCFPGEETTFVDEGLIPVLISEEMFHRWLSVCWMKEVEGVSCESAIKVNTGMGRLGIEEKELDLLLESKEKIKDAGVKYLFSHMACADEQKNPLNEIQLTRFSTAFGKITELYSNIKGSLANSAATVLSKNFHFQMVRPGISLYGGQPSLDVRLPLKAVVTLELPVLQIRDLPIGESIGYGATRRWETKRKIAVVRSGYADGILRSLGNSGSGVLMAGNNPSAPIVGRVSMDTTMFDVTDVDVAVKPGDKIQIIGSHKSLELTAEEAGTSNYEILTSLGARYERRYIRGD